MKMIKTGSETLKIENEDCYYIDDTLAFVIDGASNLSKINISDCKSDACWYANEIKKNIVKYRDEQEIKVMLRKALLDTNQTYQTFENIGMIEDFPSAVISLIRQRNDQYEFLILGDCVLLYKDSNDCIHTLGDDRLEKVDEVAIQYGLKVREEKHIDFSEARKYYQKILVSNRKLKNTKEGYYALSDDDHAVEQSLTGFISSTDIKSVVLMSDGFYQIINLFHLYKEETLFEALENGSVQDLYQELLQAQIEDDKLNDYPRFTLSDDATLVYFEL